MPTSPTSKKKDAAAKVKDILQQDSCPSAVLLSAPDRVRPLRAAGLILDKFSRGEAASILHCHQLTVADIDRLQGELSSLSLFSSVRLFLLKDAERLNPAACRRLADTLVDIPTGSYLIITARKMPLTNPVRKFFGAKKTAVVFEELKGPEFEAWVKKELMRCGILHFPAKLAAAVVGLSDGSPDEATALIEHLALYVPGDSAEVADIEKLFVAKPNPVEFRLLDAIVERRFAEAEALICTLIAAGKSAFLLLSLLSRSFNQYIGIKALEQRRISEASLTQELGMPSWLLQKNLRIVKRYSSDRLQSALRAILTADSKLKNRSLGQEEIFSELIYRLAPCNTGG